MIWVGILLLELLCFWLAHIWYVKIDKPRTERQKKERIDAHAQKLVDDKIHRAASQDIIVDSIITQMNHVNILPPLKYRK